MDSQKHKQLMLRLAQKLGLTGDDVRNIAAVYNDSMKESMKHAFPSGEENIKARQQWSVREASEKLGMSSDVIKVFVYGIQLQERARQKRHNELWQQLRRGEITSQEVTRLLKEEGLN